MMVVVSPYFGAVQLSVANLLSLVNAVGAKVPVEDADTVNGFATGAAENFTVLDILISLLFA